MNKKCTTSLQVNQDNQIVQLDDHWFDLAESYDSGAALAHAKVLNKPLSSFISDDNTRMYIEAALSLCRIRQQVLYRAYRCDSPTHKQFMELELTPMINRHVQMRHYQLKTEPFDQPVEFETLVPSPQVGSKVMRCSMCNQLKAPGQTDWMAPEGFFAHRSDKVQVIHTVCEACKTTVWQIRRPLR